MFCFVEVDVSPGGLFWWIGAGVLVVLELMSGTFYLLMIAIGCVAAESEKNWMCAPVVPERGGATVSR